MTGIPVKRHNVPLDPGDFGRCHRLLKDFPEWRARLQEVADRFPSWQPLVDNWPRMEELYERDRSTGRSAELFELMERLIE